VSIVPQIANGAVAVLLFALTAFVVYEAIGVVSRLWPPGPLTKAAPS